MLGVSHTLSVDNSELHIDLVFEKCDWDLYAYLTHIPHRLNDQQVRYLATQVWAAVVAMHMNTSPYSYCVASTIYTSTVSFIVI